MKRILVLLLLPLLLPFAGEQKLSATHYMGGEITWTCTPQGNFRFTMKLYRECYTSGGSSAATFGATEILTTTAPGFPSITMTRIALTDLSPQCGCPGGATIYCPGMPAGNANMGALQENLYTSDASYPNGVPLTGIPPVTGWSFSNTTCCRNSSANIPGQPAYWIRAMMYPYNNTNVSTCFDNSPKFDERPSTVICTGYPYTYNHVASDVELDSLAYEWAQPCSAANTPIVAFSPGYTFNSPLPGPLQNPLNVAATINPLTGVISFTSYTNGAFVTVTKVTAYKCGIKVAEIFREMQVVLLSCGSNNPPVVTPPFQNALGQYTLYNTTVYAGQLVNFSISATDFEYCPGATPPTPQTLKLFAVGAQFGAPINPGGCINPPCANLTPTPTFTVPLTGQFGVQTSFSWQTTCAHLATNVGCGSTSNTYNFLFKTMDNFCPAPGIRYATVTITVLTKPTLPSPPIHCLAVQPNGDVILSWPPVKDTMNTFNSYHIWTYNPATTSYYVVDSIFNINTSSYTHVGAGANLGSKNYFLTVRSGCNGTEMADAADTTSTMFLTAINPGPAFGGVQLNWNQTHTPMLPSSLGVYNVSREYPALSVYNVGNTTFLQHFDSITVCKGYAGYRIEIGDTLINDSTGITMCTSMSNWSGDSITDQIVPLVPNIQVVTVDNTTQSGIITWDVNQHPDVIGYVVYTYSGGVYTPLDTVWGRNSTVYQDMLNNPCNQVMSYAVAAFDSCDNISNFSLVHNTLKLNVKQTDCLEEHVLDWNAYNNMMPSLGGYVIYYNVNGGPPMQLATVGSTVLTYTHSGLTMGDTYGYMIQAYDANQALTSECCVVSSTISMPAQPDHLYIKTATVENNDYVKVVLHTDPSVFVTEYRLYRSNDGLAWSQIATLPMAATTEIEYNDYTAVFQKQSYYYMASVLDSCGYIADTSNIARTVLVDITTQQIQVSNTLVWNDYEGFDGAPTTYNIWRRVDGVLEAMPVTVYPAATGTHLDDVGIFPKSGGRFSYYIEAVEGAGNQYGLTATSLSNEVQALMDPKMFIPSAFSPKGTIIENTVFKPIGVFVPEGNYEFMIFNRMGQMLFSTSDLDQGWDGTFKGEVVPEGVYVYVVRFISATKKDFERRGTVTLIR